MNLTPSPSPSTERGADTLVLDLRGFKCPMTFVRTKVALEELADGQTLKILLDDKLASVDVPGAAAREGHEIVSAHEIEPGLWQVLLRKR